MAPTVDNIRRHIRVIGRLWLISIQRGMAFRWQFVTDLLNEAVAVALALLMFDIAYDHAPEIGGWDQRRTMVLVGVFQLYSVLLATFLRPNLGEMTRTIYDGDLDGLLLRPVSAQLLISLRQIQVTGLLRALPGVAVIIYALQALEYTPRLFDVGIAAALLLSGIVLVYSLWFMSMTLEFWFQGLWSWQQLVPNVFAFAQYPAGVYKGTMKVLFLTAVPVVLVANFPTQALVGERSVWTALHSMGLAGLLLILSSLQWRLSLRRYSSASS